MVRDLILIIYNIFLLIIIISCDIRGDILMIFILAQLTSIIVVIIPEVFFKSSNLAKVLTTRLFK